MLSFCPLLFIGLLYLRLGEVRLFMNAIPPVIRTLIDIARIAHTLPKILHGAILAGLGCPNEIIVGDFKLIPQILEIRGLRVTPRLRLHSVLSRSLGDLLAMLIHARQKEDIIAGSSTKTCLYVAQKRAIRRTKMRLCVDIIDGRCNEIWLFTLGHTGSLNKLQ